MSSTNRGAERAGLDFYATPAHCVDVLGRMIGPEVYGDAVLDAGCGTGAIALGLAEHVGEGRVLGIEVDEARAAEAERAGLVVARGDFLALDGLDGLAEHVAMNPPYTHAAAFVRHALDLVEQGGLVAALLRIGFLGSASSRLDLVGPASCLRSVGVLSKRPSFCTSCTCRSCGGSWQFAAGAPLGDCRHPEIEGPPCPLEGVKPKGGAAYRATRTDSADYAWLVWQKGYEHSAHHGADLRVFPG